MADYTLTYSTLPKSPEDIKSLMAGNRDHKQEDPIVPSPRRVRAFMEQIGGKKSIDTNDTFSEDFVGFGRQTVPVLEEDGHEIATDSVDCMIELAQLTEKGRELIDQTDMESLKELQTVANAYHDGPMRNIIGALLTGNTPPTELLKDFHEKAAKLDEVAERLLSDAQFTDPNQDDIRRIIFFNVLAYKDTLRDNLQVAGMLEWEKHSNLDQIYDMLPDMPEAEFWDVAAPNATPIATAKNEETGWPEHDEEYTIQIRSTPHHPRENGDQIVELRKEETLCGVHYAPNTRITKIKPRYSTL